MLSKLLDLSASQEEKVQSVQERCVSTCKMLHPISESDVEECVKKCSEQNRDLFRMSNASNYAAFAAFLILLIAIIFAVQK
jgi:hypothetical protein